MHNSGIVFHKELLDNHYNRYYLKNKDKIIADITMKNASELTNNFDVLFLFKEPLLSITELSKKNVRKIKSSQNVEERIIEYKKIHYSEISTIKMMIFGVEYAFLTYKKESIEHQKRLNLIIKSYSSSTSISEEAFLYSIISGVWDLLDFTPEKKIILNLSQESYKVFSMNYVENIYKLLLPYSIKTKLVSRNMSIDESITSHHFGFEDDLYEKGRKYQWLI